MPASLTTHVLDTARGRPAPGIEITLHALDGDTRREVARATTNADGRTDAPILAEAPLGAYELTFHAGPYLARHHDDPGFLTDIPIRFTIAEASHHHVPLLLAPGGYTTYRGS